MFEEYQDNLDEMAKHLDYYLDITERIPIEVFTGPSLYFHQKAIEATKNEFLEQRHLEMIYAVLPAWGMHKTGDHTTKVIPYNGFEEQIKRISTAEEFQELKHESILSIHNNSIGKVVDLVFELHISVSESQMVSSSKALHHILPNLIPPIDRKFSAGFMGVTNWPTYYYCKDEDKKKQKKIEFEKRLAERFITKMKTFIEKHREKMEKYLNHCFNTSLPKIFDNLIVAFIRDRGNKEDDKE